MKYALNIAQDNRVLSATFPQYAPKNAIIVDVLPEGNIHDYLYIDGAYVYDPIPVEEEPVNTEPTTEEILNAMLGVY